MSADLHIHVIDNLDFEEDCKTALMSTFWASGPDGGNGYREWLVDGKWVHEFKVPKGFWERVNNKEIETELREWIIENYNEQAMYNCPDIWVGQVSWLKAAIFDDKESFIPDAVAQISDIIGRDWEALNVIDDKLIEEVRKAFALPNKTAKDGGVFGGSGYELAHVDSIVEFLEQYQGKQVFTVSW